MPTPLQGLKEGIRAAESLRQMEVRLSPVDPPPSQHRVTAAALRAATVVICISAFEKFLIEAVRGEVERLNRRVQKNRFHRLPRDLQRHSVRETLREGFRGGGDWVAVGLPRALANARLVQQRVLNPAVFGSSQNSGAKFAREALRPFNLAAVFEDPAFVMSFEHIWGSSVPGRFIVDKLEEITTARHSQAHVFDVARGLSIARTDLQDATKFMVALARVITLVLRRRTSDIISSALKGPA